MNQIELKDRITEALNSLDKSKAIMNCYYNKNMMGQPELKEIEAAYIRNEHYNNSMLIGAVLDYLNDIGMELSMLSEQLEIDAEGSQA